jgi:hypothetical protein
VTLSDSEPTKGHETRGHSPWFDVLLSWIRLHSLRMSSVSACKHRGMLRWPGGRRSSAPSIVGHEGTQGALPIDRDTHLWSLSSKLQIVNSRKEWLSALVSPCQTCPTLHELGTCFVRVRGRTKTAPVGRPHAVKSPETHSGTYIEQCTVFKMSFASYSGSKFRAKIALYSQREDQNILSPYGAALSDFGEKFKRRHISPIDSRDIHQTLIESVHRAHLDHENQPKSQTKTIFAEIGEVAAFPSE